MNEELGIGGLSRICFPEDKLFAGDRVFDSAKAAALTNDLVLKKLNGDFVRTKRMHDICLGEIVFDVRTVQLLIT